MAEFGYTPELGQPGQYTANIGTKSDVANLANDVVNLFGAKAKADVRTQKAEAKYLDDLKKEQFNEAQLHLMEEQDKLYEKYNTTADPEERNKFVQEYESNAEGISKWYGFEGEDATKFAKIHSGVTNKLRLYNSNVLGKANDNMNVSTAQTADFGSMDVTDTKNMDSTIINNNRDYLVKTQFDGKKAKYFDAKFTDFGTKLKASVADNASPEEINTLMENLDIFATKIGDTVSVNNKDVTVDSTMYNGYHKTRQYLLEKKSVAVTKLKSQLPKYVAGGDKEAYMQTVERIDAVGGYENPDLKSSAIDAWDLRTQKANTSKINAMKKEPDYVNGYTNPDIVESTYKAHGGTDEQFMLDYKAKYDFSQNYMNTLGNADLTSNPKQAKLVAEDLVKKVVASGDIATAVDIAGKTGQGGVLKSYATATLGVEDPKELTDNVTGLLNGYNANPSVLSNNMEPDDKSAMFFYDYQMRTAGGLTESHIARVKEGNAEGITHKAGAEFNEEFAGKHNYNENIKIYSSLVKYGVPPQTAVDFIKKDTEAHIVTVDGGWTGIWGGMDVDLRGAPNGTQTYDTEDLEDVLTPLIDKVNDIGVEGDKKLVYDKTTGDFRLYIDEIPMQDMEVNLDQMIKLKQKQDMDDANSPWGVTTRKVEELWDGFMTGVSESIREGIAEFDKARKERQAEQAKSDTRIRLSTNKALKADKINEERQTEKDKTEGWYDDSVVVQQPEYVEEVMNVALDNRTDATALFTKEGLNDYVGTLNAGFSPIFGELGKELTVTPDGTVAFNNSLFQVSSPEGRGGLEETIKEVQYLDKALTDGDVNTLTYTDDVMRVVQEAVGVTADGVGGSVTRKAVDGKYGKGTFAKVKQAQKDQFAIQASSLAKEVAPAIGKNINPKWVENLWRHETADGSKVLGGTYNMGNIKGKYGGKSKDFTVNEYLSPKSIARAKASGKLVRMGSGSRNGRKEVFVKAPFRKYTNFAESAGDFARLLQIPRYKKVKTATTQREFITELKNAGYFTDSVDAYLKGVQHRDK